MMTSKERAVLRSQANTLETTLTVGKEGVTDAVIAEAIRLLESKELVKGKVLESAMMTPAGACSEICAATGAEGIQLIGTKFVFYKKSEKKEAERAAEAKKAGAAKKKINPVRVGIQKRRARAKQQKEHLKELYHEAAVKSAIERRKNRETQD